MKTASTVFLVLALWFAVLFGGQTEAWSWGPAILMLACSLAFGIPGRPVGNGAPLIWTAVVIASVWISIRCLQSPVIDHARTDFMLVAAMLGTMWVVARLDPADSGFRLFHAGLAISVIANVAMGVVQAGNSDLMWPYSYRPTPKPTGFFSHYNYFSNYIIVSSLLLFGRMFFGGDKLWQRALYGVAIAGAGLMVPLSGSRGGLLALGIGAAVGLMAVAVVAWRTKRAWLPAILIGLPVVVLLAIGGGIVAFKKIHKERGHAQDMITVVDNISRLEWMGLALEVSADHPITGGGSRSYSWERNGKWNLEDHGYGTENESFVHNELLQLVADYGWLGGGLVLAAFVMLGGVTLSGLFVGHSNKESVDSADAVHVGVAGAVSALLVQANFSFVFHMLPAVMLLGILFGLTAAVRRGSGESRPVLSWPVHGLAALLAPFLAFFGWKATQTFRSVWPVLYDSTPLAIRDAPQAVNLLDEASRQWPGYRVPEEKGKWARIVASNPNLESDEAAKWNRVAADAYRQALEAHPYNPELAVNLGNICSELGLADEAEEMLEEAIVLQGGLEAGFRARYHLARHLFSVWHARWMKERRAEEALAQFIRARDLLEEADPQVPVVMRNEASPLRKSIEEAIKFLEGAGVRPAAER